MPNEIGATLTLDDTCNQYGLDAATEALNGARVMLDDGRLLVATRSGMFAVLPTRVGVIQDQLEQTMMADALNVLNDSPLQKRIESDERLCDDVHDAIAEAIHAGCRQIAEAIERVEKQYA